MDGQVENVWNIFTTIKLNKYGAAVASSELWSSLSEAQN